MHINKVYIHVNSEYIHASRVYECVKHIIVQMIHLCAITELKDMF